MTLAEFNDIEKRLNKLEYCTFSGAFSYVYECDGITLTITDGGCTSTILKDRVLYRKDYNNNIIEVPVIN